MQITSRTKYKKRREQTFPDGLGQRHHSKKRSIRSSFFPFLFSMSHTVKAHFKLSKVNLINDNITHIRGYAF